MSDRENIGLDLALLDQRSAEAVECLALLEQRMAEAGMMVRQSMEGPEAEADNWRGRNVGMRCRTCMWWVEKRPAFADTLKTETAAARLGRCRRRAPTLNGWPAVYETDWCGDYKIDEAKA